MFVVCIRCACGVVYLYQHHEQGQLKFGINSSTHVMCPLLLPYVSLQNNACEPSDPNCFAHHIKFTHDNTLCDSGTSLCPGNGLVGVNKPQKKGSPKANQSPVPKIRVSHTPENNNQRKTNQTRKGLTRNLGRQQAARLVPTNLAAARGLFLPRDAVGRRRGSATPIRGATEPKT